MKHIKLDLSLEETNLILEGLGNLPFIKVHELISKIHEQAGTQVRDINRGNEENLAEMTPDNIEMIANGK